MVEAAILFPLVIAGVAAVICIIINMYLSLSLQSSMHLAIRKACGEQSGIIYRQETTKEYQWEKEIDGIRSVLTMEEEREYRIRSLFRNRLTDRKKARAYIINDTKMIRIFSLEKEAT